MNITGLSETRWKKEGHFTMGNHTIIHSGNEKGGSKGVGIVLDKRLANSIKGYNAISDRIVMVRLNTQPAPLNSNQVYAPTSRSTEEEIESFYNDLQTVKDKIPKREVCIIMGDLNAKVGKGEDKECGIGPHGLGNRNDRGDKLASFCNANELAITNTLFKQPSRRRYTWISPDMTRHQLDYIMIDKAWRTSVMNSRTRPGVDCDTDHILVTMKLRMKVYKQDKPKKQVRYNLDNLKIQKSKANLN